MEVFGKNEECFGNAIPLLNSSITYLDKKFENKPLIVKGI
jgi:hypothetical protein